jgi:hypothetical protein
LCIAATILCIAATILDGHRQRLPILCFSRWLAGHRQHSEDQQMTFIVIAHTPDEDWTFGPFSTFAEAQEFLVSREYTEDGKLQSNIDYQIAELLPPTD